jgi:hypothetical protein
MRFSLRTLLILVAVAPPVIAGLYLALPWLIRPEVFSAIVALASFVAGLAVASFLAGVLIVAPIEILRGCLRWLEARGVSAKDSGLPPGSSSRAGQNGVSGGK